jgi:hypothetical protein
VYAKLDDEPFIVFVPQNDVDGIYADPLAWQALAIEQLTPDAITGLDVTSDGQATISLVNDKGQWKPAKGDFPINTSNIVSIVSTLATLRAVQWAGAPQPAQGLDKPAVTITFTTADKKTETVKVGAAAGDYWCASAAGQDGTFLIARPDHDSLIAPIVPMAAPMVSPGK